MTVTRRDDGAVVAEFRGHSVTLSGNPFAAQSAAVSVRTTSAGLPPAGREWIGS